MRVTVRMMGLSVMRFAAAVVLLLAVCPARNAEGASMSPSLQQAAAAGNPIWIFLHDKTDGAGPGRGRDRQSLVSVRAVSRMAARGGSHDAAQDLPVSADYVHELATAGAAIRHASRWLNAVSALVRPEQIETVAGFTFVDSLQPVVQHRRRLQDQNPGFLPLPKVRELPICAPFDYGPSLRQITMIKAHGAHAAGLLGQGVRIGVMDTGFFLDNPAFDSLNIVPDGTWDFINNDADVDDGEGGQARHGTQVLSLLAAFFPGELIGVAPFAEYAFAKTEQIAVEIMAEEDAWVAGLEWLVDEKGCDLVSSSLGYTDWYTDDDYDGNTGVATIAADLAAARGALVVNAVGNEGCAGEHINIIVPADGDSVLAVGAVRFDGEIASFSSCGPTTDGRVKPDVVAPGVGVHLMFPSGEFGVGSGSSFATPLVTGLCALVLQRFPELTPYELIEHVRATASRPHKPLNADGWGLVNVMKAVGIEMFGPALDAIPDQYVTEGERLEVHITAHDPDGGVLSFAAEGLPRNADLVDSGNGAALLTFEPDLIQAGIDSVVVQVCDGYQSAQSSFAITVADALNEESVGLYQAWPNPADERVSVAIPSADLGAAAQLEIYTITGQRVATVPYATDSVAVWFGMTTGGRPVAAGIYLVRIKTSSHDELVKVAWRPGG